MSEFVPGVEMFGLYAKIKQGACAEPHIYKIVGVLESNGYVDVPIQYPETVTIHKEIEPILRVIHCGVSEEEVIRVAVKDVDSIFEYRSGGPGSTRTWKDYQPSIPCELGDIAWGIRNYKGIKLYDSSERDLDEQMEEIVARRKEEEALKMAMAHAQVEPPPENGYTSILQMR